MSDNLYGAGGLASLLASLGIGPRDFTKTRSGPFRTDSLVERRGFELPVPSD